MLTQDAIGPILFSRGADARGHRISALVMLPDGTTPPPLEPDCGERPAPVEVDALLGWTAWRFDFTLAPGAKGYRLGERFHPVSADLSGDLRIGYVSCNGKEDGDLERPAEERNVMWLRLRDEHRRSPLALLLHGGDQVYADAVIETHEDLRHWRGMPQHRADMVAATPEMEAAATRCFFDLWRASVTVPATAELLAETPSVMMWDDHDIADGWGSRPSPVQEGPVGLMLFRIAHRFFRLFQTGGIVAQETRTVSTMHAYGDFAVVAPDLRSERRLDRIMGPAGWSALRSAFEESPRERRLLVMSSVPALGPRLSLVERIHRFVPGAQLYEDDLRDQWQSRTHRDEWRQFLRLLAERMETAAPVTVLSGEIHLAARGEMQLRNGRALHQLIASGISHPAPPAAFAWAMSALAAFGEAPLADRPIAMRPLPGGRRIYTAQRNYLMLRRNAGRWSAIWELEEGGPTPALEL